MKAKSRQVSSSVDREASIILSDDRRREPRHPTSGEISIVFRDPIFSLVKAELEDWSSSGFRARHHQPRLVSGLGVRFSADNIAGTAIVVWTRHTGEQCESGFLIQSRDAGR